ncbi:hypothetical protein L596_021281 [Steinernema carpocapsae]|uniref:Uncharacterized protein n=1 Tax=Steinernema carpocapsae TaxID=34508 RepID=A0A4U5MIA9_STECR|nr:hypothetical protein L596_021281 [Steinernema carpocapsae]
MELQSNRNERIYRYYTSILRLHGVETEVQIHIPMETLADFETVRTENSVVKRAAMVTIGSGNYRNSPRRFELEANTLTMTFSKIVRNELA